MFANNPYEAKYQFLINKKESTGLKYFNEAKAFNEYSNDMEDAYKYIEEYNLGKKRKILIVFDDIISNKIHNKKPNPTIIR